MFHSNWTMVIILTLLAAACGLLTVGCFIVAFAAPHIALGLLCAALGCASLALTIGFGVLAVAEARDIR